MGQRKTANSKIHWLPPFPSTRARVVAGCVFALLLGWGSADAQTEYLKRCEAVAKKSASDMSNRVSVTRYGCRFEFEFSVHSASTVNVVCSVVYRGQKAEIARQTILDAAEVEAVRDLFTFFFAKQYIRHDSSALTVPTITWYDQEGEILTQCLILGGGPDDGPVSRSRRELHKRLDEIDSKAFSPATLESLLGDPQPHVRLYAVQRLHGRPRESRVPAHIQSAIRLLTPLLDDPDGSVRAEAAFGLHLLQNGQPDRRGVLIEVLQSDDPHARKAAASHMGAAGYRKPDAVVNALLRALQDDDTSVRYWAAAALDSASERRAGEIVQALIHALADQDKNVRCMAARSLGSFGAAASEAAPALRQMVGASEMEVRQMAESALVRIENASTKAGAGVTEPRALGPVLEK